MADLVSGGKLIARALAAAQCPVVVAGSQVFWCDAADRLRGLEADCPYVINVPIGANELRAGSLSV